MLFVKSLANLFKIISLFLVFGALYPFFREKSLYFFLKFSGTTFIKLGQILSTRPDLVGENLSNLLTSFQDKLPPFPLSKTKKILLKELKFPIGDLFAEFSENAVSSASIAQVYKARLKNGDFVAVKILRPGISDLIFLDISTIRLVASIVGIFSFYNQQRFLDIAKLIENYSSKELDLLFEAGVASELRERLNQVAGIYIPKIYWDLTTSKVLVLEWINGIAFSNKNLIRNSSFNKVELAKNLVNGYFYQVYVQGFFHADMHPGNLFLMKDGKIGIVDFGIIGVLKKKTRIAVAEILMAFLNRDYNKVAQIHIDVGFVPSDIDIDELRLAVRVIGELVVGKSVKQISLAKLLDRLIKMARSYNMKADPELLLLQKTVMLVEGVGLILDENLNMWDLAKPWMKNWALKNVGFDAKIRDNLLEISEMIKFYFLRPNKYDL